MTITHEPAHLTYRTRHRLPSFRVEQRPRPSTDEPRVEVYRPQQHIRVDTMFWQHRSVFAASQEHLDRLRREADARATTRARERARERERAQARAWERERAIARARAWERARARARARADAEYRRAWYAAAERAVLAVHRPVFKRWKPVMMAGLIPTLWAVTTCRCGDRWPCNDAKLLVRRRVGWHTCPDKPTKQLTAELPKPATRWTRLRDRLTRRRSRTDRLATTMGRIRARRRA